MKLEFENDFRQKIMVQSFSEPFSIESTSDVDDWKAIWTKELSSWHSPYKLLLNCTGLTVSDDAKVKQKLDLMFQYFKGFFLKKTVAFTTSEHASHEHLPFEVVQSEEEAYKQIGIRQKKGASEAKDFRSRIQIENDFRAHVMELSFLPETEINSAAEVATLKSKITNNLMQWHSKWNLMIDCTNLKIAPDQGDALIRSLEYFKGFFMLQIVGYSPSAPKETYPFETFRSRHKAVLKLERVGALSGNEAHCQSTKP